ncbi:hypothetical protein L596_024798 [Steinernema carpocapsae]|uniref:Serpentine receptor class gamma n=1 Tax=Steinernema carpocapsae TaxID=34508 RepID=A0A4U5M5U2_STECR|nr:hypothetical protein L596_024798 [Steinernema carpocapsae]
MIVGGGTFTYFQGEGWAIKHHNVFGIRNSLYVLVITVTASCFGLIMNVVTIASIVINKKHRRHWAEVKLFFLTFACSVIHSLHTALQTTSYLKKDSLPFMKEIFTITPFVVDLTCFTAPWFLLMTSKTFRRAAYRVLKRNKGPIFDSAVFARRS